MVVSGSSNNLDHRTLLSSIVVGDFPDVVRTSSMVIGLFASITFFAERAGLLGSRGSRGRHGVEAGIGSKKARGWMMVVSDQKVWENDKGSTILF